MRWIPSFRTLPTPPSGRLLSPDTALGQIVGRLGPTRLPVLLVGGPGRGRRWVARALHAASPPLGALMQMEMSTAPGGDIAEMRLPTPRAGDSLFLPALASLPLRWQAEFADRLQEDKVPRLLAAIDEEPERAVSDGRLRRDLLDSLAVVHVPALHERLQDLDVIVPTLLRMCADRQGVPCPMIGDIALVRLRSYRWPGDHAELEQFAERAIALGSVEAAVRTLPTESVEPAKSWPEACARIERGEGVELDAVCRLVVRQVERAWVDRIVGASGGDMNSAAAQLGLRTGALAARMRDLGLQVGR